MRKTVAIVMGIVVVASCIPWLRHQQFFSVLVGVTTVALAGFMVFGGLRAVATWSRERQGQPGSARSGWLSQRFLTWLLGAVLLGALVPIMGQFAVRRSDAYNLAAATAHQMPQFRETLGTPIREGWFSGGRWEFGNPARAELTIPVKGSRQKGNLRALAIKQDGRWRLTELTLELTQPDEHIDLLRH
jgi:hypothetical protein